MMFMICFIVWALLVAWLIVTIWLEQDRLVGLPLFAGGMLPWGLFFVSNFDLGAAKFSVPLVVIFMILEIIVDIISRWEIMEWFVKKNFVDIWLCISYKTYPRTQKGRD